MVRHCASRTFAASVIAVVGCIGATAFLALSVASASGNTVAALFPPWWSAADRFEAAASQGEIVDVGRLSSILIVRSDTGHLAARLRAAGALATLVPGAAMGCTTPKADIKP